MQICWFLIVSEKCFPPAIFSMVLSKQTKTIMHSHSPKKTNQDHINI